MPIDYLGLSAGKNPTISDQNMSETNYNQLIRNRLTTLPSVGPLTFSIDTGATAERTIGASMFYVGGTSARPIQLQSIGMRTGTGIAGTNRVIKFGIAPITNSTGNFVNPVYRGTLTIPTSSTTFASTSITGTVIISTAFVWIYSQIANSGFTGGTVIGVGGMSVGSTFSTRQTDCYATCSTPFSYSVGIPNMGDILGTLTISNDETNFLGSPHNLAPLNWYLGIKKL